MIISVNVDNKSIVYVSDSYTVNSIKLSPSITNKRISSINSEFITENECISFKVIDIDDDSYISAIEISNISSISVNNRGTIVDGSDTVYALKTKCKSGDCLIRNYNLEAEIVNGGTGYSVGDNILFGYIVWTVDEINETDGSIISLSTIETPITDVSQTEVFGSSGAGTGSGVIANIIATPFETPTTDGPTIHVTYKPAEQSTLQIQIQISSLENNGLSFTSDGKITATRGKDGKPGSGGTTNRAGNGIHCDERHEPVSILRCDLSCTSKIDPLETDLSDRINLQTAVVDHLR